VFLSTLHRSTLSQGLPDGIERDADESYLDCYRVAGHTPKALTTNGGRSVLKRLCEAADLDIDSDYLKPHGARRGIGELMCRERGAAVAQRTLRHADPRTTSEMYSHIEASELAEKLLMSLMIMASKIADMVAERHDDITGMNEGSD